MFESIHVTRDTLKPMAPPRPRYSPMPATPSAPRSRRPSFSLREIVPAGIFSRTRDILAANVADLLDRAEDPAKMIRMVVMEMEETLVDVRAASARTIADQKEMRSRIHGLQRVQQGWLEKAELALEKGREDLARGALGEKRKAELAAEALAAEAEALDQSLRAAEADIARVQTKLREARTRQAAVQTRIEGANQRARLRDMVAGPKVDEAFSRFEVLERRADLAEGRAEALALAAPAKALEEEIAELRSAEKVDAELEALKARLCAAKGE